MTKLTVTFDLTNEELKKAVVPQRLLDEVRHQFKQISIYGPGRIGDRFTMKGSKDEYLLCLISHEMYNEAVLINTVTGRAFNDAVVVDNYDTITEEEWKQLTDYAPELFTKVID